MKEVVVVTDTTACIPAVQVAANDIEVVPIELIFGGRAYRDGIDLSPSEFYARLRQAKTLPTTAGSLPGPYVSAFQRAGQRARNILCLTEPANLSGMYNAALVAREMTHADLPGTRIEVRAGTTGAAGLGLVALAAAREAAQNRGLEEVLRHTDGVMSRVELYAALDTLHYLVKGGRVPQAAALVNSLLKIKPIFTLNGGEAHTVALPRSTRSAVQFLLKIMSKRVSPGKALHVAVMHADAPDIAVVLQKRIIARFDCAELFITEFTPVMGVHTGPGLFGIAFYQEDQPSGATGQNIL
ncbi:MAG: DegV family protein [Chloroflexota bacterium]